MGRGEIGWCEAERITRYNGEREEKKKENEKEKDKKTRKKQITRYNAVINVYSPDSASLPTKSYTGISRC